MKFTLHRWGHGLYANVYVETAPDDYNNIEGFCGNFDGNSANDNVGSDGNSFGFANNALVSLAFTESWR